jgi:hypothetical protein
MVDHAKWRGLLKDEEALLDRQDRGGHRQQQTMYTLRNQGKMAGVLVLYAVASPRRNHRHGEHNMPGDNAHGDKCIIAVWAAPTVKFQYLYWLD